MQKKPPIRTVACSGMLPLFRRRRPHEASGSTGAARALGSRRRTVFRRKLESAVRANVRPATIGIERISAHRAGRSAQSIHFARGQTAAPAFDAGIAHILSFHARIRQSQAAGPRIPILPVFAARRSVETDSRRLRAIERATCASTRFSCTMLRNRFKRSATRESRKPWQTTDPMIRSTMIPRSNACREKNSKRCSSSD